jgi:signal transduction histidine kinase
VGDVDGWSGRVREARWASLPAADVVLAALLLLFAVPTAAAGLPDDGPVSLTVPVAVAMTSALAWRTRSPLVSVAVVVVAGQLQTLLAHEPGSTWAFAVYLVSAYSVASSSNEGRAAAGGGAVVGALLLQEWQEGGSDYLFIVIVVGGAWLLGRFVRQWRARATAAELDQDVRARLAVAEERARIARELHDIVAHGVSVIAVQAEAAEAVLEVEPDRAREALTVIGASAREVLDEMRRLLILLRMDDEGDPSAPQPCLDDVPELVRTVRAAGLPVELEVRGPVARLAPGVDLSAYRIVQEALTNVLKHAGPVPTSVVVSHTAGALTVEVANRAGRRPVVTAPPAGAPPGGHGLVGARERVALLGGELHAAGDGQGGFVVRAVLPHTGTGPPR